MGAIENESGHRSGGQIKPETSLLTIMIIIASSLTGFTHAYATNAIAGTLAQTSFQLQFLRGSNATSLISAMLAIFLGGGAIGSVAQEPFSNRWGRRVSTGVGAICLILSGALMSASYHIAMFLVARVISGIGCGIIFTNGPVYMAEISPPHTRGLLVGIQSVAICFGLIVSSLAALGFYFVHQAYAWRLQFIASTFFSVALLVSLFFIPESPRWLVSKGRMEEAKEVIQRLHKSKHDPEGKVAHAELEQIQAQHEADKSQPSTWMHIWRTPHLRKRAFCSWMIWILGQSTGIVVITLLLPSILATLGNSQIMQFGLSIVFVSIAALMAMINIFIIDRVGRVNCLVAGGISTSIVLLIEAILQKEYLGTSNQAGLKAATAMIYVFIIFYGVTMEAPSFVYITEIWPTHLRSKGATIGFLSYFINSIIYTTPASIAFQNIGWRYYLVFFSVGIVSSVIVYFVFPETTGLTLEGVNAKFGDSVALDYDIYKMAGEIRSKEDLSHHAENVNVEVK